MSLASGTRFGPYQIVALIGAGGMGEVYRATDGRLDRTVAIKVLHGETATDSNLRARFEREARAVSALSNPHICALYDLGHEGDIEYLVMEYLEGETLAAKIARGSLPVSQVVRFGMQIAEALQHAHRVGITHRDLKPANVMITSSGVKLLDFGLAKFLEKDAGSDRTASVTLVNALTEEGTIVGTMQYMAPELLEGKAVDHRADIFALGVTLYEMATGKRPFGGNSRASLIAAILSADPVPPRSLVPAIPSALERLILTALEKDPNERWQTAHDVARQLQWMSEPSTSSEVSAPVPSVRSRRLMFPLAFLLTALTAAAVTWGVARRIWPAAATTRTIRLQLALPPDLTWLPSYDSRSIAISEDGQTLAFVASRAGIQSLFLRRLDSLDVRKVEGSDQASSPFFSSNGEWVGFSAHSKLWKTRLSGSGTPEMLCDVTAAGSVASWRGSDILFADRPGGRGGIYRISENGGTPVKVTDLHPGEWRHSWPYLLSDGRHFLYQIFSSDSMDRQLALASLDSPIRKVLTKNVSQVAFVGPDRFAFVRDGRLMEQRLDLKGEVAVGDPVVVARDVSYFYPSGRAEFDASPAGVVVYRTDTSIGRLLLVNRTGATIRVIDDKGPFFDLSISNDGKTAAVTVIDRSTGLGDIWLYDLVRGIRDRFTSDPGLELGPIWSADGTSLVYSAVEGGAFPHLVRRSLSSPAVQSITPPGSFEFPGSFSPDGKTLYYTRTDPKTRDDLFRLDLAHGTSAPFLQTAFNEEEARSSPDGKWLAFSSDTTGASEVYLQSLTDPAAAHIRVSTNGGSNPRWRKEGGELFYLSGDQELVSVTPTSADQWGSVRTAVLFHTSPSCRGFDVAPDGQSFLLREGAAGPGDGLLQVVLNPR